MEHAILGWEVFMNGNRYCCQLRDFLGCDATFTEKCAARLHSRKKHINPCALRCPFLDCQAPNAGLNILKEHLKIQHQVEELDLLEALRKSRPEVLALTTSGAIQRCRCRYKDIFKCDYLFGDTDDELNHSRVHFLGTFYCILPGCLKRFTSPEDLTKHIKRYHRGV